MYLKLWPEKTGGNYFSLVTQISSLASDAQAASSLGPHLPPYA